MDDFIKLAEDAWSDGKFVRVGPEGFTLYVKGLCYSKQHLLDGEIPEEALPFIGIGIKNPSKTAQALVDADLWEETENGYRVKPKRWGKWQQTKEQVETQRNQWKEKKARQRAGKSPGTNANVPGGHQGDIEGDNAGTAGGSPPRVPRQEKEKEKEILPNGNKGDTAGDISLGAGWEPFGDWLDSPELRAELSAIESRRSPGIRSADRVKVEAVKVVLDTNQIGLDGFLAALRSESGKTWRGLNPEQVLRVCREVGVDPIRTGNPGGNPESAGFLTEAELQAQEDLVNR